MAKLIEQKQQAGELAKSGTFNGNRFVGGNSSLPPTLKEIGITKEEKYKAKKLASIPDAERKKEGSAKY